MGIWQRWRDDRAFRARAAAFARGAWAEPSESEVRWLAERVTGGDEDHARWELRYCRRVLALLVAERDALDDRTAAAVAHALVDQLRSDRSVAAARLQVAERQFNLRLARYREVLRERMPRPLAERWAAVLVAYASGRETPAEAPDARLVAVVDAYWTEAQASLREQFGVAQLPEHVKPSEAGGRRS